MRIALVFIISAFILYLAATGKLNRMISVVRY